MYLQWNPHHYVSEDPITWLKGLETSINQVKSSLKKKIEEEKKKNNNQ